MKVFIARKPARPNWSKPLREAGTCPGNPGRQPEGTGGITGLPEGGVISLYFRLSDSAGPIRGFGRMLARMDGFTWRPMLAIPLHDSAPSAIGRQPVQVKN